jgi:hypothetical protein
METSLIRVCDATGKTQGTGFLVSDSLAVTCAHVVTACGAVPGGRVRIIFHVNGEGQEAEVLQQFWRAPDGDDIAVLRFEAGVPPDVIPVRLGRTSGTDGHRCATLGYPRVGMLQGVEGRGEIYRSVSEANGRRLIQLASKEITTGFSGAPLLDQVTGRVIGMITQIAEPDRYGRMGETAFATPADVLYQLMLPLRLDLRLHPPQAVEDYLKAVAQFCRDLPYVSLKSDVPLETVYVRQQIRQELKEGQRTSDEETAGEELATLELRARPMTVFQALEQHPRMVVVGGAGAGKSTLLRHLVQEINEGASDWLPHLPILVSLRGLAEQRGDLTTSLRKQIQAELGSRLLAPMPENFLTDWAHQTEMPLLIALDGLDEIVGEDDRRTMIRQLKQAAWPAGSDVLITTRPDTSVGLDGFTAFDLLPFEPEQVEEFAHNWFRPDEDKARAFLTSLQTARMGDVIRTPLLLTLAATIFEESPDVSHLRALRRSKLYGEFVRILLAEDAAPNRRMKEQFCQQFRTDLGERLFDYRREVLEGIALALQEGRDAHDALVECLQQVVGWSDQDAARKADDVLKILAQQRAGLVVRRGDRYEFIHPSVREYLAAAALAQACGSDTEKVWSRVVSHWSEENWREVALFAMGILSDESIDVTPLLKQIWQGESENLFFAVDALAEQVRVTDDFTEQVSVALLALACDKTLRGGVRLHAGQALMQLGRTDEAASSMLRLVREEVPTWVHLMAAQELVQWGWSEEVFTLARDETVDARVRRDAARWLVQLGRTDEAATIVLTLAHSTERHYLLSEECTDWLGVLGRAKELLTLARDETVDARVRLQAYTWLLQLGQADDAVAIMPMLLSDLERMAQELTDGNVRRAVLVAVEQIRRRLSGE